MFPIASTQIVLNVSFYDLRACLVLFLHPTIQAAALWPDEEKGKGSQAQLRRTESLLGRVNDCCDRCSICLVLSIYPAHPPKIQAHGRLCCHGTLQTPSYPTSNNRPTNRTPRLPTLAKPKVINTLIPCVPIHPLTHRARKSLRSTHLIYAIRRVLLRRTRRRALSPS